MFIESTRNVPARQKLDCIVTRVVPSGKWRFAVLQNRFALAVWLVAHKWRRDFHRQAVALLLQSAGQEVNGALPGVGRVLGSVTGLVVRIFKRVTRVRINLDVDLLARLFQRLLKFLDVRRRNPLVLTAEVA